MSKHIEFDFERLDDLFEDLTAALYRLEHAEVEADPITGAARHNSASKAEVSRDLLYAQDLAEAISTELKLQYWRFKGKR